MLGGPDGDEKAVHPAILKPVTDGFEPACSDRRQINGKRIHVRLDCPLDLPRPTGLIANIADDDQRGELLLEVVLYPSPRAKRQVPVGRHADLLPKLSKHGVARIFALGTAA